MAASGQRPRQQGFTLLTVVPCSSKPTIEIYKAAKQNKDLVKSKCDARK